MDGESNIGEQVWVLTITHKHGAETAVFRSEDAANDGIVTWVDSWWDTEMPEDIEIPDAPEERVRLYFETVEDEGAAIVSGVLL